MRRLFVASAAMASALLLGTLAATTPPPNNAIAELDGYGVSVTQGAARPE